MNILVTGGAGFVGSHLVEALLKNNHSVTVLDNLSSGKHSNVPKEADLIVRDAGVHEAKEVFYGRDAVFHLAASPSVTLSIEQPLKNQKNGENLTVNVLDACRIHKVKRLIFASSASVYGLQPCPNTETDSPDPLSPYAVSKLASEYYLKAFSACANLDTVSLRFFNIFGPRQDPKSPYSGVISIFAEKMSKELPIYVYGNGTQTRDFVYIENIIHACLLALQCPKRFSGDIFNIGSGKSTSINYLIQTINNTLSTNFVPVYLQPRAGEVKHSLANIEKAQKILDYKPIIEFEEGIRKLLKP